MHRIVLGGTGSGKTYYAKKVVDKFIADGGRVVIFNPMEQDFNVNAEMYGTPENFYEAVYDDDKKRGLIVVDEAPVLLAYDKNKFNTFMTNARHRGGALILVQRPKVVLTPTILSQCDDIVCFKLNLPADNKYIAKNTVIPLSELEAMKKENYDYIYTPLN